MFRFEILYEPKMKNIDYGKNRQKNLSLVEKKIIHIIKNTIYHSDRNIIIITSKFIKYMKG